MIHQGSHVWNKIVIVWQKFSSKITYMQPSYKDEVLTMYLWWTTHYIRQAFGFSRERAIVFMALGMKKIRDLWDQKTEVFMKWDNVQNKFGLETNEYPFYKKIVAAIPLEWLHMLTIGKYATKSNNFLGLFERKEDTMSIVVVQGTDRYQLQMIGVLEELVISSTQLNYEVGLPSQILWIQNKISLRLREVLKRFIQRV